MQFLAVNSEVSYFGNCHIVFLKETLVLVYFYHALRVSRVWVLQTFLLKF